MVKQAETIKVGGGADYAKVSERIKLFREENPNGLIETTPSIEGNIIMFKCRVLKDKARPESAEATGHSIGENKGAKALERLESISVGRALAMLGYLASGEIATSEEMEEFNSFLLEKEEACIVEMSKCEDLEALKSVYMSSGSLMGNGRIIEAKNNFKATLTNG